MAINPLGFLRPLIVARLLAPGGVRTRKYSTGGGDVSARHMHVGPGGFVYFNDPGGPTDPEGDPYVRLGASGSPGEDFELVVDPAGAAVVAMHVDNDSNPGLTTFPDLNRYTAVTLPMGVPNGSVSIPTGECARAIVVGNWTLTDWFMITDAAGGPFRVEVLKISNASYDGTVATTSVTGTTNAAGGVPRIALGSVKGNGGGNVSSWPNPTLTEGDVISGNVLINTAGAKFAFLVMLGVKRETA